SLPSMATSRYDARNGTQTTCVRLHCGNATTGMRISKTATATRPNIGESLARHPSRGAGSEDSEGYERSEHPRPARRWKGSAPRQRHGMECHIFPVPLTRHNSWGNLFSRGVRFALTPRYLLKPLRGGVAQTLLSVRAGGALNLSNRATSKHRQVSVPHGWRRSSQLPTYNCGRNTPANFSFVFASHPRRHLLPRLTSSERARSAWNIVSICAARSSS